jgi:hypothetical protein
LSTPEAPAGVSGFDRRDWTDLLGCLAAGIGVSFGLLLLLMRTVLEPQLVDESVRRINRNVRLVEGMLIHTPVEEFPKSVMVRSRLPSPENNAYALSAFDREVRDELRRRERLAGGDGGPGGSGEFELRVATSPGGSAAVAGVRPVVAAPRVAGRVVRHRLGRVVDLDVAVVRGLVI